MAASKPGTQRKKKQELNLDTLGNEMGNKPPQAIEVEEAVLGAMLLEPECVDLAMEELTPSCFYDPKHRMIFEAMSSLVTEHTSVDIITVGNRLKSDGRLEDVGGYVVLANLSEKVGSAAHIEYYVKILKQKTIQRDLITASHNILTAAFDESIKVDELIDKAQSWVYESIQSNVKKEVQDIGSLINVAMNSIQEKQSKTGFLAESWHFRYVGRQHAKYMYDNNLCLEEYIEFLMKHPHVSIYENGSLRYEIYRIPETAEPSFNLPVPNPARNYQVSFDNMGGIVMAYSY